MVVPAGIGPTMNAYTDGPMDTAANDAWAGISAGIAMVGAGGEFLVQQYPCGAPRFRGGAA
jgi:hypothetical protein